MLFYSVSNHLTVLGHECFLGQSIVQPLFLMNFAYTAVALYYAAKVLLELCPTSGLGNSLVLS